LSIADLGIQQAVSSSWTTVRSQVSLKVLLEGLHRCQFIFGGFYFAKYFRHIFLVLLVFFSESHQFFLVSNLLARGLFSGGVLSEAVVCSCTTVLGDLPSCLEGIDQVGVAHDGVGNMLSSTSGLGMKRINVGLKLVLAKGLCDLNKK
jgi:hypothetical protein